MSSRWLYGSASEERLDSVLDFQWTTDDLITETGKDYISIRWTGYLLPAFSEVYTVQVTVNDGARVWVDDVLLIDQYDNEVPDGQSASVFSGNDRHPLTHTLDPPHTHTQTPYPPTLSHTHAAPPPPHTHTLHLNPIHTFTYSISYSCWITPISFTHPHTASPPSDLTRIHHPSPPSPHRHPSGGQPTRLHQD